MTLKTGTGVHVYTQRVGTSRMTIRKDQNQYTFNIDGYEKTVVIRIPPGRKPSFEMPDELLSWMKWVARQLGYFQGNPYKLPAKDQLLYMTRTNSKTASTGVALISTIEVRDYVEIVPFTAEALNALEVRIVNDSEGLIFRGDEPIEVQIVRYKDLYFVLGRYFQVGVYEFGTPVYDDRMPEPFVCDDQGSVIDINHFKQWVARFYKFDASNIKLTDRSVELQKLLEKASEPPIPQRTVQIGDHFLFRVVKGKKWALILTEDGKKYGKATFEPSVFSGREHELIAEFLEEHLEGVGAYMGDIFNVTDELLM